MNKHSKNKILLVLAVCSFLVGFDSIVVVPLIPIISERLEVPIDIGGIMVASYALAYSVSAPFFGALSDRKGRRKILLLGLMLFGVGTVLCGIANSFIMLNIFRVIAGIGAGMITPATFAIVGDYFPYKERGRAIGIVTGALIASSIIGVPVGGYVAEWFNWGWPFYLIGFLTFITIIPIILSIPVEIKKINEERNVFKQIHTAFSSLSVFLALLATLLYYGALQGMFANTGVFYHINFKLSSSEVSLILMCAGLGSVIGSVLGGKIADKIGKPKVILLACILVAVSVFSFSLSINYIESAIIIHILWATFYGVGQTAITAVISELRPEIRGTIMALNSSAMYLGSTLFITMATILINEGTFLWLGIISGIANLLVIFVMMVGLKGANNKGGNSISVAVD